MRFGSEFIYYDVTFLILFCISLVIFLYRRRKRLQIESRVFILYRTKVGLNLINRIGSRYKRFFHVMDYIVISTGYILMIASLYLFFELTRTMIRIPEIVKITKIPPLMPLIPYLPQLYKVTFLPPFYFTYWIIVIAIIACVHEFSHGIFARHHGVRIKSTGFGFLGPFLAAFVEPDEKQLAKKGIKVQLSVLAAGSFANVLAVLVFTITILIYFQALFAPSGVVFSSFLIGKMNVSDLTSIGYLNFDKPSAAEIASSLKDFNRNYYDLQIKIDSETINLTRIKTAEWTYFLSIPDLAAQLERAKKSGNETIYAFYDLPAIRAGLNEPIVKINGWKITNQSVMKDVMKNFEAGDEILIETIDTDSYEPKYYNIRLAESPLDKNDAILGIGFAKSPVQSGGVIMRTASRISSMIRDPLIFYKPRFKPHLIIFLYNLIWWIVFINVSVALVNMLPLGIFDGGRVFYLTALGITKSKRIAQKAFKYTTMAMIALFIAISVLWWIYS